MRVIAGGCMRRLMSMCYRPHHNENNMRTVRIHDPEIEENASLRTCASHVWFCWVLWVVIFNNIPKTQCESFLLKQYLVGHFELLEYVSGSACPKIIFFRNYWLVRFLNYWYFWCSFVIREHMGRSSI